MAVTQHLSSGKAAAMGAMGQLTLRMEALQQRGEQLRGGRGETRLSRFPATSLSSPASSPSISPTSPAPPSRPSVPSYMASTTNSRVTAASLRSSSTSSTTRQSETSTVSQNRSSFRSTSNSRQSESTSSSLTGTKSSVRSLSASRQSESSRSSLHTASVARQSETRSSLRSSSGTRRAEVSSSKSSSASRQQEEFSRSSSGRREGEISSSRSSLRSSSATRHSELTSSAYSRSSAVRSTSASRQSETTRSINSALRSNPMIELIDLRSNSKENLGRSSRESSRPGSRSQLSSSSKENIGVSSRDIARSSCKENMRSNVGYRDSSRSSSTENMKANVLGSRENVSRGLRENVANNKRRSARASTMSNFGGYWPSSAPPSFNSQLSEPGLGGKRESMLPPKSVSSSRENMRNSNANLSRGSSHRSSFHESRSSVASSSKDTLGSAGEASRSREAVISSTKKRSVRASTISSLSEWSSSSRVVRASNETRSSLATNGESINSALRSNPMIELIDLRPNSKENQGRSSRMTSSREAVKLPPKSGACASSACASACASSRENVVSSKKKSVRASTMSSLRELEVPKPPVMPSRDRSWGRSQQPLSSRGGGRDASGSRSRPRPDSAPLESPRLSREVLAKLGNRQTKVVGHSGSGKLCAACEKPLTDDGFFAMGTLFHQACFRCGFCNKKLSQKYFTREDKPACAKCHSEAVYKCGVCQLKIPDDHIQVNKTYFHPRCMKCQVCDELQTSRYITYKDLPICEEDYKAIGHVCEECGSILTGELFTLHGRILCETDFKALELAECGACTSCDQLLSPTDSISVGGVTFHHGCLLCVVCGENMEGKPVTMDSNNRVYCTEDYTKQFSVMCAGCKKAIVPKKGQTKAPRLRAMDRDYHLECFKCEDCSLVLQPGVRGKECWPVKTHLFCYKCYRRRQSESEIESDDCN